MTTTTKSTNATGCIAGLVFCFLLQTIIPIKARIINAIYTNCILFPLCFFMMQGVVYRPNTS